MAIRPGAKVKNVLPASFEILKGVGLRQGSKRSVCAVSLSISCYVTNRLIQLLNELELKSIKEKYCKPAACFPDAPGNIGEKYFLEEGG